MSKQPLFSIVMPTRNRAALLKCSIQSALRQTFDDYEIVVVDNNSPDNTEEVVRSLAHPRLRYVRSEISRSMPDNWEFAWTQARGKYVCFLCDDDAYLPNTLSFLAEKVLPLGHPVMSWDLAIYTYPDWIDRAKSNSLMIPAQSADIKTYSTEQLARDLTEFKIDRLWWPRMNNSCVESSVLEKVRQKLGRLFHPLCPDYSFMNVVYHSFETVCVVHRPLSISGTTIASIGSSQVALGENATTDKFLEEFGNLGLFDECKSRLSLVPNMIAMTVLKSNEALEKSGLKTHEVDWHGCFTNMARALREIKRNAPDFFKRMRGPLLKEARSFSKECASDVSLLLEEKDLVVPLRNKLTGPFGKVVQSSEFTRRLELLLRYGGDPAKSFRKFNLDRGVTVVGGRVTVNGNIIGTKSILDMSEHLNTYFDAYRDFKVTDLNAVIKDAA